MTGPGRGCEGYSYVRCTQIAGQQVHCTEAGDEYGSRGWRCDDVHPACLEFDFQRDFDIDIADWAVLQRQWRPAPGSNAWTGDFLNALDRILGPDPIAWTGNFLDALDAMLGPGPSDRGIHRIIPRIRSPP